MKFAHTLHINAKEIEVLCRALDMYEAHVSKMYAEGNFSPMGKEGFGGYRNKVINMAKLMGNIKKLPKPCTSEAGLIPNTQE